MIPIAVVNAFTIFSTMKVETSNLKTLANFAKLKNLSRQRVYILVKQERFNFVEIDGVKFIVMNQKALSFMNQK